VDGRLRADLGRIRQVSARLGQVEREFSNETQFTGGDGAFLGSADLAAALDSCVSGWSQRRTALISQLANVARLSALAASTYEKTDAQLATVLDKAMNNGTGAQA
jgi:2-keto-3-deoxy-L-rhamnonate aldolase RhmA